VVRELDLKEENKDYQESRGRGDEPQKDLYFWKREQKKLAQDIVDHVLPSQKAKVRIRADLEKRGCWGESQYRTPLRAQANFIIKKLVDHYYGDKIEKSNPELIAEKKKAFKTYFNLKTPSEVFISHKTLTTEYSSDTLYGKSVGAGFLPTTVHETAHVSNNVKQSPVHQPWVKEGHDEVWEDEAIRFRDKAKLEFGEEVKNRFIEYRKIISKEHDKI
jgi:hypothetical protein